MQSVTIIAVGKLKDKFFADAAEEYIKRLKSFCKIEIVEIPQTVLSDSPTPGEIKNALDKEADLIIKKIPANADIIPLCIEGKQYPSEEFAKIIANSALKGKSNIVFIIGGSVGLSDKVKNLGNIKFSMSKMTFPHRLARIMLLEQIYRAYQINAGTKYHK